MILHKNNNICPRPPTRKYTETKEPGLILPSLTSNIRLPEPDLSSGDIHQLAAVYSFLVETRGAVKISVKDVIETAESNDKKIGYDSVQLCRNFPAIYAASELSPSNELQSINILWEHAQCALLCALSEYRLYETEMTIERRQSIGLAKSIRLRLFGFYWVQMHLDSKSELIRLKSSI
jgi:hypothetical protein